MTSLREPVSKLRGLSQLFAALVAKWDPFLKWLAGDDPDKSGYGERRFRRAPLNSSMH
jgi:hypothetical protein